MPLRILILADPYCKPAYTPRLRYVCDYLIRQGHQIDVYTEAFEAHDFEHHYPIHEKPLAYNNTFQWALHAFWSLLTDYRNRAFTKWVSQQVDNKVYDLIFCTTFSTFPLRTAHALSKRLHIPMVVDIRDIEEQVPGRQYQNHRQWWARPFSLWYRNINIMRRNRALKQAHAITTISPWHVDFLKHLNPNVHLIYNGYDPEQFYAQDIPTETFDIAYIGRLYPFQNIQPVQQAIEQLHNPDIRLVCHTPQHQPIPIHQVGDVLRRTSIAVVLTSAQTHGMMTTKFYDALGCEKPVLCVPSDQGVLEQTIQQTNAGIATDNIEQIKHFISDKYNEWKQQGYTRQPVREKHLFSRLYQTERLEQILLQTTQPTISIIIPYYNAATTLNRCLDSILMQSYPHLEIILINDGSTDQSPIIAQQYAIQDSRIRLIDVPHAGQSAARNQGLTQAKGTWISFIDSDDYLPQDLYAELVRNIPPHTDILSFGFERVNEQGQIIYQRKPHNPYRYTVPWNKLYRKDFLDQHHITFVQGMYYEDVLFNIDAWLAHPIQHTLPIIGYHYVANNHSTTATKHPEDQKKLFTQLHKRLKQHTTCNNTLLLIYTIIRLKLHFLRSL